MLSFNKYTAISFIFFSTPTIAVATCVHGINQNMMNQLSFAVENKDINAIQSLSQNNPTAFCPLYELGIAQIDEYKPADARQTLRRSYAIATPTDKSKIAIKNAIGFTYILENDMRNAIESFTQQIIEPTFPQLPQEAQAKVYNNLGYAHLQLDEYGKSGEYLNIALNKGNSNAKRNIEILRSLKEAQESGTLDSPGIFTVALWAGRGNNSVKNQLNDIAPKLGVSKSKLSIFKMGTGMKTVSYGSYISYPKAQEYIKEAKEKGINDAYIMSLTDQSDITGQFN